MRGLAEPHKNFKDIMPQIRKTGKFILDKNNKLQLDKLNYKLDNYKQELTYYYDKYKFVPSSNGYIYILLDINIKYGKKIICYKIGYNKDMNKRMNVYKTGNFMHKLLCYIPIHINYKDLELIIKKKLTPHLTKLITDTICYLTLDELKKEILGSLDFMMNHICNCMFCKKSYKFYNINHHKCNTHNEFIDMDIHNIIKLNNYKSSKILSKKSSKILSKKSSKNSSKILRKYYLRILLKYYLRNLLRIHLKY